MDPVSNPRRPLFRPGTLRQTLARVAAEALRKGVLVPIPTLEEHLLLGDVNVVIRVVQALVHKDAAQGRANGDPTRSVQAAGEGARGLRGPSPFLPYEEALYVADVTDSHVAVLNKFNVVEEHLLVVSRAFESQELLLGREDFAALFRCLAELEALGFYNGGLLAGASQGHRHLQLVPLPLSTVSQTVPIEPLLARAKPARRPCIVEGLPFRHAFVRLPDALWGGTSERMAEQALSLYLDLLGAVDRSPRQGPLGTTCDPYNLLCTREWMLVVPRVEECFAGISLNSLAFVGAFLVRDQAQAARLRQAGPWRALAHAAGSLA